ncbi:MAG: PAS domain-containing sensor histidine kinase [bacterium]
MKEALRALDLASMHKRFPAEVLVGFLALSSDAIIAMDEHQRIVFFNAGAERIFGWRAEEVGGQPLTMLLPERYRSGHRSHVEGFANSHGAARTMGERSQISGLRKSGEEFGAEASIQQINVDGHFIFAATLRDISPRQRAEDALRQAVKARDDMIGIVSHDLRNPANAVKMLANSIVAEKDTLPASIVERVSIILQAADQIDRLIQDLLDVTRLEAGRLSVRLQPLSAKDVIVGALKGLGPLADSSAVSVHTDFDDGLPEVLVDPDRVSQVMSNLVGNAVKFTLPDGRVDIVVRRTDDWVEVRVRDNGIGIPADQLPHVFDRFYQDPSQGGARRHGAGLGLPIARGIVEAHGGRMWVESEQGVGTTVCFTLLTNEP